jgi:restriction endonuclease S subunit
MDFDCGKVGKIVGDGWVLNQRMTLVRTKDISVVTQEYLYWMLQYGGFYEALQNVHTGTTIKHISGKNISEVLVSIPPLPIQQEIVESLDLIYNNANTAKAAAVSIKAQMAAVMRSVGARGYEKKKLGDVLNVKGGKAINKENLTGTKFPYYGCNGVNGYVDEYLFEGEYIICAQDGSIGSVYMVNEKFYPSNHTHIINTRDNSILTNQFGSYYLKMCVDWKPLITSIIPKVTQAKLLEIPMVIPPLSIQQEILAILNEMEAELKVMEQMAAKAEQRAKYILEGYLSSQPTVEPQALVVESQPVNEIVSVEQEVQPLKKRVIKIKKNAPPPE